MIRSMLSESLEAVIAQKLLKTRMAKAGLPACEVMIANTAIRNLIREDRIYQIPSIIQSGGVEGMQSLDQDLYRDWFPKVILREKWQKVSLKTQNYLPKTFYEPKEFESGHWFY